MNAQALTGLPLFEDEKLSIRILQEVIIACDTSFYRNTVAVFLAILTKVSKRLNLGTSDIWNFNETDIYTVKNLTRMWDAESFSKSRE